MSRPNRLLIRIAAVLQTTYAALANRPAPVTLPESSWRECVTAARLLEYARRRLWRCAIDDLEYRVRNASNVLAHEFGRLNELLRSRTPPQRVPSLRDLYDDLVALHAEYETVRIDRRGEVLAVRTDPIILEGIDLGPFEIRMRWTALPDPRCYTVDAVQPRRSSGDGYTHPHVLQERLCEGDGRLSIQHALADGRLGDFFQIVTRILKSYNAESAYCRLEDWDGRDCSGCGDSIRQDESWQCSRCGAVLCSDCDERCNRCDESFCSQCVSSCASCEDVFCHGCLRTCPECEGDTCAKCRQPDQRCRACASADEFEDLETSMDAIGPTDPYETETPVATPTPDADT